MKVLVTGAGGFVGKHLMAELRAASHEAIGTSLHPGSGPELRLLDLRDRDAVDSLIDEVRPEGLVHLAGLAYVPASETDLGLAVSTNIGATAVILDRLAERSPGCRMLLISSGEIYGRRCGDQPIGEQTPADANSAYSITKLAAEALALHVNKTRKVSILIARPFNHIGPGQSELFVAPAFARQIAAIEVGHRENVVRVGNLDARRDFTDVRDVVRAYRLMLEKGTPGEVYNVCSGEPVRVQRLLDMLLEHTSAEVRVEIDPDRLRPSDLPVFCGDATKLQEATDWARTIDLSQTLADVLQDWRARLASSPGF